MHRLKTIIVGLVFIAAGLAAMVASLQLHETEHPYLKALFRELATVFIVAATLHAVYEWYLRDDFAALATGKSEDVLRALSSTRDELLAEVRTQEREVIGRLDLSSQASQMGLTRITYGAAYDYADLLAEPGSLQIVLNDGRTWVSNNAQKLRARFEDRRTDTTIYLVHPTSPMVEVLAAKEGTNAEGIRNKLHATLQMLSDLGPDPQRVRVFGHRLYNPYAIYLTDSSAVLTPYFHSRSRRTAPAFRYDDIGPTSFYRELHDDVSALRHDSASLSLPNPTVPPKSGA